MADDFKLPIKPMGVERTAGGGIAASAPQDPLPFLKLLMDAEAQRAKQTMEQEKIQYTRDRERLQDLVQMVPEAHKFRLAGFPDLAQKVLDPFGVELPPIPEPEPVPEIPGVEHPPPVPSFSKFDPLLPPGVQAQLINRDTATIKGRDQFALEKLRTEGRLKVKKAEFKGKRELEGFKAGKEKEIEEEKTKRAKVESEKTLKLQADRVAAANRAADAAEQNRDLQKQRLEQADAQDKRKRQIELERAEKESEASRAKAEAEKRKAADAAAKVEIARIKAEKAEKKEEEAAKAALAKEAARRRIDVYKELIRSLDDKQRPALISDPALGEQLMDRAAERAGDTEYMQRKLLAGVKKALENL